MKFTQLKIEGAYLIELEEFKDERGSFARQFCKKEFTNAGIDFEVCQCNLSKNYKAGVLRGMHTTIQPHAEAKIVSCYKGSVYDVIVDVRKDSKTYLQWQGFELTEDNNKMLYVPPFCAHGFQTLEDNTVIYYQMGEYFANEFYAGVRWNDPKIGIVWPECQNRIINERDRTYELI